MMLAIALLISSLANASQLAPAELKSLASSSYIVLGKVSDLHYDAKTFQGTMTVQVEAALKGKVPGKTLEISVDKNPISGFDVLLNKGDLGVFFFREIKNGKAVLQAPGSSALFPKEVIQ